MKNVTLSADEDLTEQARRVARSQHKTLNAAFREWLMQYTAQAGAVQEFDSLMERFRHVRAGRRFSRDEMNERFFLDTNVFIYSFDRKSPAKARRAMELITKAVTSRKGIASYQVVPGVSEFRAETF